MMDFLVTEGRATELDRRHLLDQGTYGIDWLVVYASSPADAIHQWGQFKEGIHATQAKLEEEAAAYRRGDGRAGRRWSDAEPLGHGVLR